MGSFLGHGELMLVETDRNHYLGTVEVGEDVLVIRSGFAGRPAVVRQEDVVRVALAAGLGDDLE